MRIAMTAVIALLALCASGALAACGSDSGSGGDAVTEEATEAKSGGSDAAGAAEGGEGREAPVGPTIVVREGEPVDGVADLEYSAGQQIRFTVRSDAAEEIHVHGYDIAKDVPAGGQVSFDFPAEIEGIFEVELEDLGQQIAELRVNP